MIRMLFGIMLLLTLCIATHCPAENAARKENKPLLSGPEVDESEARTLVQYDLAGRLILLQQQPEEAAVGLLVLDPDRRAAAGQLFE